MKPIYLSILFFTLAAILMLLVFLNRPRARAKPGPRPRQPTKALPAKPSRESNERREQIIAWIKQDPEKVSQAVRQWMRQEKP